MHINKKPKKKKKKPTNPRNLKYAYNGRNHKKPIIFFPCRTHFVWHPRQDRKSVV